MFFERLIKVLFLRKIDMRDIYLIFDIFTSNFWFEKAKYVSCYSNNCKNIRKSSHNTCLTDELFFSIQKVCGVKLRQNYVLHYNDKDNRMIRKYKPYNQV